MGELLTTTQAAKRARTSRPTISRALKNGDLVGVRGNDQKWMIDSERLAEWAKERAPVQPEQRSNSVHEQRLNTLNEHLNTISADLEKTRADLSETRESLARAESRAETLADTVDDLRRERDRLLTVLETRPAAAQSFWTRLFFGSR